MFRKNFGRRKRLPTPMTIRRGNGASGTGSGVRGVRLSIGPISDVILSAGEAGARDLTLASSSHAVVKILTAAQVLHRISIAADTTGAFLAAASALHAVVGSFTVALPW